MSRKEKKRKINLHGITLEPKVQISSSKAFCITKSNRFIQYAFGLICMYAMIYCFVSSFNLWVNQELLNTSMFIIYNIIFFTFIAQEYIKYIFPVELILYLIFLKSFFGLFKEGLFYIENQFIGFFNHYYGSYVLKYQVEGLSEPLCNSIFLIFVFTLLMILILAIILLNANVWLYICTLIPIIGLPMTVGTIPHPMPFLCLVITSIGMFGMSGLTTKMNHKKLRRNSTKNNIENMNNFNKLKGFRGNISITISSLLAGVCAAIAFFVFIVLTPSRYDSLNITQHKADFINFMNTVKIKGISLDRLNSQASGGIGKGKLGNVGELKFENRTDLLVRMPKINLEGSTIYLKGFVGGDYSSEQWQPIDSSEKKYFSNFNNYIKDLNHTENTYQFLECAKKSGVPWISYTKGHMQIMEQSIPGDVNIGTYGSLYDEWYIGGDQYEYDFYVSNLSKYGKGNESASNGALEMFAAYDFRNSQELENKSYYDWEKEYREYVYGMYTKLPDKGCEKTIRMIQNQQFLGRKENFATDDSYYSDYYLIAERDLYIKDVIRYINNYLATNTSYTLTPGVTPQNKDFVDYFLFENKKGFCVHYASSAAIMLRAAGIPTRYVEGYIVTNADYANGSEVTNSKYTDVLTYSEGILKSETVDAYRVPIKDNNAHAWVEIYLDGYGWVPVEFTSGYSNYVLPSQKPQASEKPESSVNPSQKPSQKPKESKKPQVSVKPSWNQVPDSDKMLLKYQHNMYIFRIISRMLMTLIITAVIILILLIMRYVILKLRYKYLFKHANMSQKVKLLYKEIEKIISYYIKHSKYYIFMVDEDDYLNIQDYIFSHADIIERVILLSKEGTLEQCFKLIMKQVYSPEDITDKDFGFILNTHKKLRNKFYLTLNSYTFSFMRKVFYKYIKLY